MAALRALRDGKVLFKVFDLSCSELANLHVKRDLDKRLILSSFEMFKRSFRGSNRDTKRRERKTAMYLKSRVPDPPMEFDLKAFMFQNHNKEILSFQKRLGIVFNNENYLKAALVSQSFLDKIRTMNSLADLPSFVNADSPLIAEFQSLEFSPQRLSILGLAHTQRVITSNLFTCYPQLPAYLLDRLATSLGGRTTIAKLADILGITELIINEHDINEIEKEKHLPFSRDDVVCDAFFALMGAIYLDLGIEEVRKFVNDFIMTYLDDEIFRDNIRIRYPLRVSTEMAALAGHKIKPEPRLIFSAGRNTDMPLYIVGIFSGDHQLGEGASYTLKKAEVAAFENSIYSAMWRKDLDDAVI